MRSVRKPRRASPVAKRRKRQTRQVSNIISLAIGEKTGRPACVLLQAMFKTDALAVSDYFPAKHWLVQPDERFLIITGTPDEWREYARRLIGGMRPKLG